MADIMGLSAAEAVLLAAYRQLDADQQEQLIAWAWYLVEQRTTDTSPTIPIERGRRVVW